jgi:uncharacterized phage-associated protein
MRNIINMAISSEKYKQAILFLCDKLGGEIRGKKKLAKLLYYLDFDHFEKNHKSITGDTYKALPMGPYPESMSKIIKQLTRNKKLNVEMIKEYENEDYNPTEIYKSISKPDVSVFSNEEKATLRRIIKMYGHLNGKQLEDLTHVEAPYIATAPKDEIAYELAYYRGTDFKHA